VTKEAIYAAKRRFVELLFDGTAQAAKDLDFGLGRMKENAEAELKKLDRSPCRERTAAIAGTYGNDILGTVTVSWSRGRALFDARDWKRAFGIAKDEDGAERLVLTLAPYVGFDFLMGKVGEKATLTLLDQQRRYVFTKR
jgi:hypothetical protein